jgi:hypothetical protein
MSDEWLIFELCDKSIAVRFSRFFSTSAHLSDQQTDD